MAITVERTTKVIVGELTIEVKDLPTETQNLINYIDDWRQDEQDAAGKLLLVQTALAQAQHILTKQVETFISSQPATPPGPGTVPLGDQ